MNQSNGRSAERHLGMEPKDRGTHYVRLVGLVTGAAADNAIAGGLAFSTGRPHEAAAFAEFIERPAAGAAAKALLASPTELQLRGAPEPKGRLRTLLSRLTEPRQSWAGLSLDRPRLMGVVNVTPDSFSDGGAFLDRRRAIEHGQRLLAAGADLLDVGGESTRPGAEPLDADVEIARVVPVIQALAEAGALVSVDTRHARVMAAAIEAGARIVNDIEALRSPQSLEVVARSGVAVVLMHMQGEPRTMQEKPSYRAAALDIFDFLEARIDACERAGIARADILVDPGIGFGKTLAHNLDILSKLGLYRATGCGVLLGVSRKGFIGRLAGGAAATDRLPGSLAAGLAGVAQGADVLRVHDVAETAQALRVTTALALQAGGC